MTTITMRAIFKPQPLAAAVVLGCCAQAHAVAFTVGEIEGTFDSSLSVGASWGMRDADKSLVGIVNGGSGQATAYPRHGLPWSLAAHQQSFLATARSPRS